MKNQLLFIAFFLSSNCLLAQGTVDTIPPTIQCKSTLTLSLPNTNCLLYLWATDFIDDLSDNATNPSDIQTGVRKPCTGVGFPEQNYVIMYELGPWQLEVWAKDEAGNTSTCTAQIICTQDNASSCDPGWSMLFSHASPPFEGIDSVEVYALATHCIYDTVEYQLPSSQYMMYIPGFYETQGSYFLPTDGYALTVTPRKNTNPLNGVTTQDLVLIKKHLLNQEPFTEPWQYVAADANQDGKITTYDVVLIQKLILGLNLEFPNGKSWRFWHTSHNFPAGNPLSIPLLEILEHGPEDGMYPDLNFKGVKIGDVNGTADPLH
jgi:hypothetical protein